MFTLISANWISSSCMRYIYRYIVGIPSPPLAFYLPSSAVVEMRCHISSGHKTVSRKYPQHPLWKITPHFSSSSPNPTALFWAHFLQLSPRRIWDSFSHHSNEWLTHFLVWPVTVTQGVTLHSGCPILTRDPCRTPWLWVPLPMGHWVSRQARPGAEIQLCSRSSSAGRGTKASAHFAAWLLAHHGWKLGMLQFFFDFAIYKEPS